MGREPEPTIWDRKAHTRVKHDLLRRYLNAWFPILTHGAWASKRLIFLDGFAGPGVYAKGEAGSPIVAMTAIAEATVDLSNKEFVFLFVEEDEARVESLEAEIARFRTTRDPLPNFRTHVIHGSFPVVAEDILKDLENSGASLAPTFAMIDPFGFEAAPMDLIARLLRFDRCEVFFNFMLNSVNRWVEHPNGKVAEHMRQLFGTHEFGPVPKAGDPKRRPYLIDLYERQLHDVAKFTHVSRFHLVNDEGKPNVLFHGTRHEKGLSVMRRAIWDLDPVLGRRFDAREDQDAGTLFDELVNLDPLRTAIVDRFHAETVSVEQIEQFVLLETPFDPSRHLRKSALKTLEQDEGWITKVVKPDGSRRNNGTFPARCRITFSDEF